MRVIGFILFLLSLSVYSVGQTYNPLLPPNSYRNKDNPNYWKNRPPFPGYWQQDVHYTIKANIDEKTDIISGSEKLQYWNNSPDELNFVYFHLYQNAFQPDSYYDALQKANKVKPPYSSHEVDKKGTVVKTIQVNGEELKVELDNTILKVFLNKPLKSGESITFDISFETFYGGGEVGRRMKKFNSWGQKHYDGVHWYPRICVYDRKFGWETDQHLGKEFYGDFGAFDVELTFSSNFVVDATGNLLNRNEVLPEELRKKLDLKNFDDKPWNSPPSTIIPYNENERKTWKFHAENVHDFAFTADPNYRIGEAEWNGIECIALAQESHAAKWQNAADYTAKIIKVFSEDIGMYTYHKMIVADAQDGMEYPMLTLDGGADPTYRGLFVHEIGHNWFFGQVGNNETYRAALDEGFTQFLTVWGMNRLEGDTLPFVEPKSFYLQKFDTPDLTRYRSGYYAYIKDALKGEDPPLITHSDGFGSALGHGGGYRQMYYKTATMLYNLQYVLGDSLFLAAMQNYFSQWKICHPYVEDFRNSIIQYTHVDLNWFFDQWFETSKIIDYSISNIRKGKSDDEYILRFERKGSMQMPLDFTVHNENGKSFHYYIPNTWHEKQTEATVLPRWIGWDRLNKDYEASVIIPGGLKDVVIDTTARLGDINMLNNFSKTPITYSFDHRISNTPDNRSYEMFIRPDLWYNGFDGLKTGIHMNGDYMDYLHKVDFTLWFNSGMFQQKKSLDYDYVSYRFSYSTPTNKFMRKSNFNLKSKVLDGLNEHSIGFDKTSESNKTRLYSYLKVLFRPDTTDLNYLLYPTEWLYGKYNHTLNIGLDHNYKYRQGNGQVNVHLRTSAPGSDFDYSSVQLTSKNETKLWKFDLRTRVFGQLGWGSYWAPESQLFLSGANPEEMMDNKYTRSAGFFDPAWTGAYGTGLNHFQHGGGLNLRGYAGYMVAQEDAEGNVRAVYKGHSGASVNAELDFNRVIGFNPRFLRNAIKLNTYLFGDAGVISYNQHWENLAFSDLRADAGVGTAFTIQRWGVLDMVNPLTIRLDMPFFLNRIPATDSEFLAPRWIIGVNRTF